MDEDLLPERPAPPRTWRDVLDQVAGDRRRALLAACVAVVVAAAAGWWLLRPPPAPATELSLPFAGGGPTSTATSAPPADLVVHAAGAVAFPGVHRVPAGSRVADLLAAAGGPAPDADVDRVNLAAPLADGQQVWFPRVGEPVPPPGVGAVSSDGGDQPAGPLDLNTATVAELEALPGIGPSIAAAIVEHRDEHGPFASVDDLLDVAGIGPARLEDLRALVTV